MATQEEDRQNCNNKLMVQAFSTHLYNRIFLSLPDVDGPLKRHLLSLTLRGLSLFLKMFTISNTGVSTAYILATIHFLYPKLGSFSNMEYYFYQLAYRDSKVPKCFVGLIQMQCSPSFDCNWGKQNDFRCYSKGNVSVTHQIVWVGPLKP